MALNLPPLNDDMRLLRARFFLRQYAELENEVRSLSPEFIEDGKVWLQRAKIEQDPSSVANEEDSGQFDLHVLKLFALDCAYKNTDQQQQIHDQVYEQLQGFLSTEFGSSDLLHIYLVLLLLSQSKGMDSKAITSTLGQNIVAISELLGRPSQSREHYLEKLYLHCEVLIHKNRYDLLPQIVEEMVSVDADDILTDLATIQSFIHSPLPSVLEKCLLKCREISDRYGPSIPVNMIMSTVHLRLLQSKDAFQVLKSTRSLCQQQGIPIPAEVILQSMMSVYHHPTSNDQSTAAMIKKLEEELQTLYPYHSYFTQKQQLALDLEKAIEANQ